MDMFLMVAAMSLLGVAVSAALFADERLATMPSSFFVDDRAPRSQTISVPIEVLLLQIERHVRLEQAAAESFLDAPTVEALHTRTASPLVH
jgi:hypothetical protein